MTVPSNTIQNVARVGVREDLDDKDRKSVV